MCRYNVSKTFNDNRYNSLQIKRKYNIGGDKDYGKLKYFLYNCNIDLYVLILIFRFDIEYGSR